MSFAREVWARARSPMSPETYHAKAMVMHLGLGAILTTALVAGTLISNRNTSSIQTGLTETLSSGDDTFRSFLGTKYAPRCTDTGLANAFVVSADVNGKNTIGEVPVLPTSIRVTKTLCPVEGPPVK